jgi:hypothetical protein
MFSSWRSSQPWSQCTGPGDQAHLLLQSFLEIPCPLRSYKALPSWHDSFSNGDPTQTEAAASRPRGGSSTTSQRPPPHPCKVTLETTVHPKSPFCSEPSTSLGVKAKVLTVVPKATMILPFLNSASLTCSAWPHWFLFWREVGTGG